MSRPLTDNRTRLPSFKEEDEQHPPVEGAPGGETTQELGEQPKVETTEAETTLNLKQAEKKEEASLKSKYPGLKTKGASSFLAQKRLQRGGHKFFDSGDYNLVPGKKPGLSGAAAGASKTKPEKVKVVVENKQKVVPVSTTELRHDFATADAIISRRMELFRSKSDSNCEDGFQFPSGRNTRSGSMFVGSSGTRLDQTPAFRRGSMFPMSPQSGSEDQLPPPEELLQRRRQSMIPAIPSKLAL